MRGWCDLPHNWGVEIRVLARGHLLEWVSLQGANDEVLMKLTTLQAPDIPLPRTEDIHHSTVPYSSLEPPI